LLRHARPRAAIVCFSRLIHEKIDFPPSLAAQALLEAVRTDEPMHALDQYTVSEMIAFLQTIPSLNADVLFQVEWAYLPLLEHEYGGSPTTLERRLATSPGFFCEVLGIVFRSDKEIGEQRQLNDAEQKVSQNAYRLLRTWRTVPGRIPGGSFDGVAFVTWLQEVTQRTKESGHFRIALNQIGHVLPYSPPDPDGLWIHRTIAEALNAKDAKEMRSGFTGELFNMRGVHGFSAGKEELEISGRYRKQAEALEEKGFHRFATAMRELAKRYERDAERESKRDPFED
jgi:hypothetical protein